MSESQCAHFADRGAGHGGQTKDLDGDEDDGYDEVIYPVDFRQVGHITDDEMHRILVKPLQPGTRLTAIFDSCHSGTALDLPYIYSTQGILKEPNLAKEAGQGLLGVIASYSQGDIGGMIKKGMGFFTKATKGEEAHNRALATKTSPADVIMLSGSKDDQTSYVSFLLSVLFFSGVFWFCLLYVPLRSDHRHFHVRPEIEHRGAKTVNQGSQECSQLLSFFLFLIPCLSVFENHSRPQSIQRRNEYSEAIILQRNSSIRESPFPSFLCLTGTSLSAQSDIIEPLSHLLTSLSEPTQPLPPRQPVPCRGLSSPP